MPSLICDSCRLLMDFCYRFKQICKKADTSLKQFPLTGQWPEKLTLPQYPEELLKVPKKKMHYTDDITKNFLISASGKISTSSNHQTGAQQRAIIRNFTKTYENRIVKTYEKPDKVASYDSFCSAS